MCIRILIFFFPDYLNDNSVITNGMQSKVSFNTTIIADIREAEFIAYS
jgi:hypothetical protein